MISRLAQGVLVLNSELQNYLQFAPLERPGAAPPTQPRAFLRTFGLEKRRTAGRGAARRVDQKQKDRSVPRAFVGTDSFGASSRHFFGFLRHMSVQWS